MASLGNKNITKIFAGGNHSWVVIDDVVPVKDNYRVPSPTKTDGARANSSTPIKINTSQRGGNSSITR